MAWLLPEDSHLGGRVAIPESPEEREHRCPHCSASLMEEVASGFAFLHLCPGIFPGIMTLRDKPMAVEQKHSPPSQQARPRSVPQRAALLMWSEEPGFSRRTRRQVPDLALSSCVLWASC